MATQTIDLGDGFIVEADTSTTTPEQLMKMKRRAMVAGVIPPRSAAPAASTQAGPQPKAESKGKSWMLDALPSLGGMLGGGVAGAAALPTVPVGGPLGPVLASTAGAGLGGAVGEGARQLGYRAMGWDVPDPLSREALTLMAGQGMGQAGAEAMGLGMSAGVGKLARPFMGASLALPKKVLEEGLVEELGKETAMRSPTLTALEERISPSVFGSGGTAAAQQRLSSAAAAEAAQRQAATSAGQKYTVADLSREIIGDAERGARRSLTAREKRGVMLWVRDQGNAMLDQRSMDFVKRSKGRLQSSGLLDAFGRPIPPRRVGVTMQTEFSPQEVDDILKSARENKIAALKGVAAGTKSATANPHRELALAQAGRSSLINTIPGQEAARKRTQSLIGLTSAMKAAEARPFSFTRNISIPTVIAGGVAGIPGAATGNNALDATAAFALAQLMTNRGFQGMAGLAAQDQILQAILRQAPRGAGALLFPPEGFPAPADSTR